MAIDNDNVDRNSTIPPGFKLISMWGGHSGAVTSVAWSPDGSRVASGSNDQTVKLWEAETGVPAPWALGQPPACDGAAGGE